MSDAIPFDARPTRVGAHVLLPEVVAALGGDPAAVFDAAGVAPAALADADGIIAMSDLARLVAAAVAATGRRDLGLRIGAAAGARFVGQLLLRLAQEADLGAALNVLALLLPVNTRAAVARLHRDNETVVYEITISHPFGAVAVSFHEAIIAITCASLRALMGADWRPRRVELAHAPTTSPGDYAQVFGAPARCHASLTGIVFAADDLARRLSADVAATCGPAESAIHDVAQVLGLDIVDRVRAAIRRQLADPRLSLARVAAQTAQSPRSLNRHLAARGTSFAALLRDARVDVACQLLAQTRLPLASVAAAVGYSEQAAFSRAFRASTGESPRRWRQHKTA